MRLKALKLSVAVLGLVLSQSPAFAGDVSQSDVPASPPANTNGGVFGNIHLGSGVDGSILPSTSTYEYLPYLNGGGKIAWEPGTSGWGVQADADFKYADYSWSFPYSSIFGGNLSEFDSALHGTYTIDDTKKLGVFTGYASRSTTLSLSGSSANVTFGEQAFGAEGLIAAGPQTTLQLRGAILAPMYVSAAVGSASVSYLGPDFGNLGYMVGGTASQQFSPNWSARLDASYSSFVVKTVNVPMTELNTELTGQYSFDSMPLTYGLSLGYNHETVIGAGADILSLSSRFTYSFGGPPQGSNGHLFHSGIMGWTD